MSNTITLRSNDGTIEVTIAILPPTKAVRMLIESVQEHTPTIEGCSLVLYMLSKAFRDGLREDEYCDPLRAALETVNNTLYPFVEASMQQVSGN